MLDGFDPTLAAFLTNDTLRFAVDLTLKSFLILAFAGIVTRLMVRTSAASRHWVWTLAVFGVLLMPFLSQTLPQWQVNLLPAWTPPTAELPASPAVPFATAEAAPLADPAPLAPAASTAEVAPPATTVVPAPAGPAVSSPATTTIPAVATPSLASLWEMMSTWSWSTWLLFIWITGFVVLMIQLVSGSLAVWWMARHATPIDDPEWDDLVEELGDRLFLTRPVRLLQSPRTAMPMTWGSWNPVVLLPVDAGTWDDTRRRCVLMHEMAHIKRWDCLTQTVAQFTCALNWFNPLIWVAARELRIEREKACDDYVLTTIAKPSEYASELLSLAQSLKASFFSPLGAVSMARPNQLEGRVLNILRPHEGSHALPRAMYLALAFAAGMLVFPLASLSPWATSPQDAQAATFAPPPTPDSEDGGLFGAQATAPTWNNDGEHQALLAASADTTERAKIIRALSTALNDEDPSIRKQIAHTLGEMEDPLTIPPLANTLRNDPVASVRSTAAWALGELEDPRTLPALLDALDDESADVRETVIWALGELEDPRAIDGLMARVDDPSARVRAKVVWALAELEDPRSIPALIRASSSSDAQVRKQATWALGELEDSRAMEPLMRRLSDEDAQVRKQAAWGLGELKNPNATEALMQATRDADAQVRRMAVWALGEIEDPRATPALMEALNDADHEVQNKAIWALGEIEDPRAYPAYIKALESDNDRVRKQAAWALGEMKDPRAITALSERLLNDEAAQVREQAAWALGEIGDSRALDALMKALQDPDRDVRRKVAWALGEMDYDADSYDQMERSSTTPNPNVDINVASSSAYSQSYAVNTRSAGGTNVSVSVDGEALGRFAANLGSFALNVTSQVMDELSVALDEVMHDEHIQAAVRQEVSAALEEALDEGQLEQTINEALREAEQNMEAFWSSELGVALAPALHRVIREHPGSHAAHRARFILDYCPDKQ